MYEDEDYDLYEDDEEIDEDCLWAKIIYEELPAMNLQNKYYSYIDKELQLFEEFISRLDYDQIDLYRKISDYKMIISEIESLCIIRRWLKIFNIIKDV